MSNILPETKAPPPIPGLEPAPAVAPAEPEPPPPIVLGSRPEPVDPKAQPTFLSLFRTSSTNEEWSDPVRRWGHQSPHNHHALTAMKKLGEFSKDWGALFELIKQVLNDMGTGP